MNNRNEVGFMAFIADADIDMLDGIIAEITEIEHETGESHPLEEPLANIKDAIGTLRDRLKCQDAREAK